MKIHTLDGNAYLFYSHPMVYIWRRGPKYLYIGCCVHGLGRIFDGQHHVLKRWKVQTYDTIELTFFYSVKEMAETEIELIKQYKPKYNRIYK